MVQFLNTTPLPSRICLGGGGYEWPFNNNVYISLELADLARFVVSTSISPSTLSWAMLDSSLEKGTLGTFFFLLDI